MSPLTIDEDGLREVLTYIENCWPKLVRTNKADLKTLIGLPNPYIVPADARIFQEQYYWDSYLVVRALIDHPRYSELAIGMVDNLLYLVERFGMIPNASRFYFLSRSQPPLLSSMVFLVFQKTKDRQWLKRAIRLVEQEYDEVWTGKIHLKNYRLTSTGLSRYYDLNVLDVLAETESGWDMTARFGGQCLSYCPVDLNCLLYLYEQDLSQAYRLLADKKKSESFQKAAHRRAALINKLMWNNVAGYYFDYNFVKKRKSPLVTIAGVYPMNVGIASREQAEGVVKIIERVLQKKYGIVQSVRFVQNYQWDWPNGWAPLQLRAVEGLLRYGYIHLAKRLITKWLALMVDVFGKTGELWEKYDVVHGRIGEPDRYPTQPGFAWTNATFVIFANMLKALEKV